MKRSLLVLCLIFITGTAFAFPQRIIVQPNVASFSNVLASENAVLFNYGRHTDFISVYNSSSADNIFVRLDGATMEKNSSQSYAQIPAGGTLSLNLDTTGLAIAPTSRTAAGPQQFYVYVTFEREP